MVTLSFIIVFIFIDHHYAWTFCVNKCIDMCMSLYCKTFYAVNIFVPLFLPLLTLQYLFCSITMLSVAKMAKQNILMIRNISSLFPVQNYIHESIFLHYNPYINITYLKILLQEDKILIRSKHQLLNPPFVLLTCWSRG